MSGARPLVIELVGPAGAGKTSVVAAWMTRDPGVRPIRRLRRTAYLRALLPWTVSGLPALAAACRRLPPPRWSNLRYVARLQSTPALVRWEVAHGAGTVVLDEGPAFALAMLSDAAAAAAFAPTWLAAVAQWRERLDAVVWLDAPDVVLAHRIRTRAKDHAVKRQDAAAIEAFLRLHRRLLMPVVAALTGPGGARLIALPTDRAAPQQIAARLCSALESGDAASGAAPGRRPTLAGTGR